MGRLTRATIGIAVRGLIVSLVVVSSASAQDEVRPVEKPRLVQEERIRKELERLGIPYDARLIDEIKRLLPAEIDHDHPHDLTIEELRTSIARARSAARSLEVGRLGDEAAVVRQVQAALNEALGTDLAVDGVEGSKTRNALEEFQRRNNLLVTGSADEATRRRLGVPDDPGRTLGEVRLRQGRLSGHQEPVPSADPISIRVVTTGPTTSVMVWSGSRVLGVARSPDQLRHLVPPERTVLHEGDDLTAAWQHALEGNREVRMTDRSPKVGLSQHSAAVKLVDQTAVTPDNTNVYSALPGVGATPIEDQLRAMGLRTEEASQWEELHGELAKSGLPIADINRDALLADFYTGTKNVIILTGHYDVAEGKLYIPNATPIDVRELEPRRRNDPAERVIILIACDAGRVNGSLAALGEKLIEIGAATAVIAPTAPVSGLSVPGLLRALFSGGKLRHTLPKPYQLITIDRAVASPNTG